MTHEENCAVIVGIGVDLVEVARIKGVIERRGDRFLQRIFTDAERRYCLSKRFPEQHFAARFAAKEAFGKALGLGTGQRVSWASVSVDNDDRGRPQIVLRDDARREMTRAGATKAFLSLSHTKEHAIAQVALEE